MQISSVLRIHPRFMRAVHLERDIKDPRSSTGYIPTNAAEQALRRICDGLRPNSTQRMWRLAGDYGCGKTDFGLVLARVAQGRQSEVPKAFGHFAVAYRFSVALATGDSEPVGVTILRAIGIPWKDIQVRPPSAYVLEALSAEVKKARRQGKSGLLLIIDELGKNLEYATRNPDSDDVFLLQQLANYAAGSGAEAFAAVVMLHQGFAAYTDGLDSVAKKEWTKVAGRFEEIVYAQPIGQVAALVAATLNVDLKRLPHLSAKTSGTAMTKALSLGLYGNAASKSLATLGPSLFPIHPTTLPVLVRAMRRFGQNERSLFSFLSSSEPMGMQQHAAQSIENAGHYRTHHFFDYVRSNLLSNITSGSSHTHWGVIEAVLASISIESPEEERILKTISMFSLLDAPDLPATEGIIMASVGGDRESVARALASLRSRGVVYERGSIRGLCLWPHTSVNLDELFAKAVQATMGSSDPVRMLCDYVQSEPLVSRSYYAVNGTLRYGEVKLIPGNALHSLLAAQPILDGKGADLNIRVVVPKDKAEQRTALQLLRGQDQKLQEGLIILVADPQDAAIASLSDLVAWTWIKQNTRQLSGDRYAREEVARQILQGEKSLRTRLGGLDNLAIPNGRKMEWFSATPCGPIKLAPGRELLSFLGDECHRIYSASPTVLNELINRRTPSSAAVAARTKLAEAIATSPNEACLGMDEGRRPPEMALYLSVVKHGGFHVQGDTGWAFRLPTTKQDKCRLIPALNQITRRLKADGPDALVSVPDLFSSLAMPPYGVREGLQPFILAIYLAINHQHVALYEDGTYRHEIGGELIMRLVKEPQFFQLQYSELSGARFDAFDKILEILKLHPRDASRRDLFDLVRPLVTFVGQEIPEYSRRTQRLSAAAIGVRKALLDSKEPIRLVFSSLPQAVGLQAILDGKGANVEDLALKIKAALQEIRASYPALLIRLEQAVFAAFDIDASISKPRSVLCERASQLSVAVTDPSLKAFAIRLGDTSLKDRAWTESIANYLAKKSPERWIDHDEAEFHHQLEASAGRFKRTELTVFGVAKKLNGHACRIALTKSDGAEVGDLIDWDGLDETKILPIEAEFVQLLSKHGRDGLAGAMRALWSQLNLGRKRV